MKKSQQIAQSNHKRIGNYEIIKKIGKGLTAQVYQAKCKNSAKVSIKTISSNFSKTQIGSQLIKNQIKILSTLNHPNVLKFIQKIEELNKIHIVTSFCQGGDLESYLEKHKKLDQKKSIIMIKHIIEGCLYLRSKQIVHRDIKPSNIFLLSQIPVIADFGFAVLQNDKTLMKINAGSPLYMPYQSLALKKFSQKSDVFAVGVCLYEMLNGKTPWNAHTQRQLIQKMKVPPKMSNLSNKDLGNLISACLSCDLNKRPTFKQMLIIINNIENQLIDKNQTKLPVKQINLSNIQKAQIKQKSFSYRINDKLKIKDKQNIQQKDATKLQKLRSISTYQQKKKNSINQKLKLTNQQQKQKTEDFLTRLNPDQFKFLPQSIIIKFKLIIYYYKKLISGSRIIFQQVPKLQEKDSLIQQIKKCNTEIQLCKCIESFTRRLFRLTKNYKQYNNCLVNLEKLYQRVTTISI